MHPTRLTHAPCLKSPPARAGAWAFAILTLLAATLPWPPPLRAEGGGAMLIKVTTTVDTLSGPGCSLRAALRASDLDQPVGGCPAGVAGVDRVRVPPGLYALVPGGPGDDPDDTGDLDVTGPVEVVGAGAELTTIRPAGAAGAAADRVLEVRSGGAVSLAGVTVRDGRATRGGGLYVGRGGVLGLADCRILGNQATSGGGLYLDRAEATLARCDVADNLASAGGGLYQLAGTSTIRHSLFEGNGAAPTDPLTGLPGPSGGGGAVAVLSGSSTVEDTEIVDNRADDTRWGGGGLLAVTTDLVLSRSTLAANAAVDDGAPRDAPGGGGVSAWRSAVRLENATLSGNSADDTRWGGGGVLVVDTDVAAAHATFWDNKADGAPTLGGRFAGGSVAAPARRAGSGRSIVFAASILSGASPAECLAPAVGPLLAGGAANAIDDATCDAFATSSGPVAGFDPVLAMNGGATRTHLPPAGSSAVDAAGAPCRGAEGGLLTADQRGAARPQDGACDLGAVERTLSDLPPSVELAGFVKPAILEAPGGAVTITVAVTNRSPGESVTVVALADDIDGPLGGECGAVGTLAPGETATCTYTASFAGAAGDLPVRTLTVEVEDDLGNAAADDVRVGPRIRSSPGR